MQMSSMLLNPKLTGDIYSTSEVKTNKKWINGKPIYRKVFEFSASSFTSQKQSIAHNIANIDKIIRTECFFYRSDIKESRFLPSIYYGNLTDWAAQVFVNDTVIKFELGTDMYYNVGLAATTTYVILEYTKTTD